MPSKVGIFGFVMPFIIIVLESLMSTMIGSLIPSEIDNVELIRSFKIFQDTFRDCHHHHLQASPPRTLVMTRLEITPELEKYFNNTYNDRMDIHFTQHPYSSVAQIDNRNNCNKWNENNISYCRFLQFLAYSWTCLIKRSLNGKEDRFEPLILWYRWSY